MNIVSCSSGVRLVFITEDEDLRLKHEQDQEALNIRTYKAIRDRHGIWASNQNKFVKTRDDLNDMDSKHMECLYSQYGYLDTVIKEVINFEQVKVSQKFYTPNSMSKTEYMRVEPSQYCGTANAINLERGSYERFHWDERVVIIDEASS